LGLPSSTDEIWLSSDLNRLASLAAPNQSDDELLLANVAPLLLEQPTDRNGAIPPATTVAKRALRT
jgi:hypothetical protein